MSGLAPLAQRTIGGYLETLGSSEPAPGGGSVAGLVGALAAGLGQMVISLTLKGGQDATFEAQFETLVGVRESLLAAAAADERAYGGYVDASRLPKATDDEKAHRRVAMQAAIVNAANVPLMLAEAACGLLEDLEPVARKGTAHALSDAEIAIMLAHTSVKAALVNVRVNLPLIKDEAKARSISSRAGTVEARADRHAAEVRAALDARRNG